jgi:hypothetical protein
MFKMTATIGAAMCVGLFLMCFFVPATFVMLYGASADTGAAFMGRRASSLFLGLAVIFWLAREAPRSTLRDAICYGAAVAFGGAAVTGLWSFLAGTSGLQMILSAAGEAGLAALFALSTRRA